MARTEEREKRYETAIKLVEAENLVHAERLNGRTAMLGIAIGIATEALTGRSILNQIANGIFGFN